MATINVDMYCKLVDIDCMGGSIVETTDATSKSSLTI